MFDLPPPHAETTPSERMDGYRQTARRVLKDLFNLEVSGLSLSDNTTLLDFAEDAVEDCDFSRVWALCLKEQVYARYGIACEADEPLVDVLARLESAEHGVHVQLLN